MDAITNLVATVALLLALAAAEDATKSQVKVSSSSTTRSASSRPVPGCDDEFGCGTNHNETLVRDATAMN
ncbi:MAG TPA: hypothetical protein VJ810_28690 [Blastocatellia bacterium]|nr:hypothetical protein [Blastocatellia bacterium]